MLISQATPSSLAAIWERRKQVEEQPFIADLARRLIDGLYETFEESLVLARAFLTIPFNSLPTPQQEFATALARSVGRLDQLGPHTATHSLIATRGRLPEWNGAATSRGHVAIPLLSHEFVSSIPMMSRLLKDLGLPLAWVQDAGAALERQLLGAEIGCFWVADAARAVDELGRKVIPAQDFVSAHSVRSVFAVGGVMFGGAVLTLIFFSSEPIESRTARAFMPLVNGVKATLLSQCSISRVFRPVTAPASPGEPLSGGAP